MVSRARAGLFFDKDTLTPTLKAGPAAIDKAMQVAVVFFSPQVRSYARMNATWKDQTGNARNGLMTKTGKDLEGWYILLFHRVSYGIWLEVAREGKYQIIMPTLRHYLPIVLGNLHGLLRRLEAS